VRVTPECDSINSLSICTADGIQGDPDVAFDGNNYMVVWSDLRFAGNNAVYGTRVTPAGAILDPAGIQIGPVNGTYQKEPSIIFIDDKYFVVWGHLTSPYGITGRFVNTDGTLGDTVHIATPGDVVHSTDIAYDGSKMFVVWAEYPGLLRGQFVSTSGTLIGSPFTIADDVLVVNAGSICFSGSEYFVIYSRWEGSVLELWGRKYDVSGNPIGSAFRIANPAQSCSDGYVVAGDDYYLCVYSRLLYPSDIYGNLDTEVGIEDSETRVIKERPEYTTTITSGSIVLPDDKEFKIFDIMGREVTPHNLRAGIYFVVIDSSVTHKVIKVR
jgi:hypothetical protein